jgi:hypothetical protein
MNAHRNRHAALVPLVQKAIAGKRDVVDEVVSCDVVKRACAEVAQRRVDVALRRRPQNDPIARDERDARAVRCQQVDRTGGEEPVGRNSLARRRVRWLVTRSTRNCRPCNRRYAPAVREVGPDDRSSRCRRRYRLELTAKGSPTAAELGLTSEGTADIERRARASRSTSRRSSAPAQLGEVRQRAPIEIAS